SLGAAPPPAAGRPLPRGGEQLGPPVGGQLGLGPVPLAAVGQPARPWSFHRCRTSRTVMTDSPTTSATWAGVRGSSARSSSQTACHRGFSTGCRHARYLAPASFALT